MYREANHLWQKFHRNSVEKSDTVILEKRPDGIFINKVSGQEINNLDQVRQEMDRAYHYCTYSTYKLGYLGRIKFIRERLPWLLDLINIFNYYSKNLFVDEYRIIDKTPPNIYRITFLKALYPDAKFIYLTREKEENVNSLINAWCHPKKFKYKYRKYLGEVKAENYPYDVWKFFIPFDYKDWMQGKTIEEICEHQYEDAHQAAERAFRLIDPKDYMRVDFENLLLSPSDTMVEICEFLDISYGPDLSSIIREMPLVNTDKNVLPSG